MTSVNSLSVPLPTTPAGWVLKSGLKRTLNDEVMLIHDTIISTPKLCDRYLDALRPTTDEESSEGWLGFDDVAAVKMIKDYAAANGHQRVAAQNGAAIRLALNVVLKRYGMSRKERRYTIAGQVVPANGNHED